MNQESKPSTNPPSVGNWDAPSIPAAKGLSPGDSIADGRYTIQGILGRGGMGTVYEATQAGMDRAVAIKVLHREYSDNPSVVRRFHREAMAVSRLAHPNSITVYDFGQSDGVLFMAMECLRGRTLKAELHNHGPLSIQRSLMIIRQILRSVAEAHGEGIVHRDLKPDNIFLTSLDGNEDFVKVLDFGVAKLWHPDRDATLTQAGNVFGTPKYMAPEQARDGAIDGRADLYAVGVLAYELMVGRPPFIGENPLSLLLSHANEAPPRMMDANGQIEVPEPVEALVFQALAKDPENRFQTAQEFGDAVGNLLEWLANGSKPGSLSDIIHLQSALNMASSSRLEPLEWEIDDAPQVRRPRRRKTWLFLPVFIGIVAIGWWFFSTGTKTVDRSKTPVRTTALNPSVSTSKNPEKNGPEKAAQKAPNPRFTISTVPENAQVIDTSSKSVLGTTPAQLNVSQPQNITLSRAGYADLSVRLDPANPQRKLRFVLEKKSKRQKVIKRRTKPTTRPSKTRTKKTAVFVSPIRESPKPIPIQPKKTEIDPPLELE